MNDLKYPSVEAVLAIHAEVLAAHGGAPGLTSRELLESAVAAPQASMLGERFISEPIEVAAALLYYLCGNHPFVDGNKRVALATCLVFLSANNLLNEETLDPDPWESLTFAVAAGRLDRSQTTEQLRILLGERAENAMD